MVSSVSEIEVLIGGKAGEGIGRAGQVVAELLSGLGYNIYLNFDHPSLIKGGHNFSIVRASAGSPGGMREKLDLIIALDKNTINLHKYRFSDDTIVILNSDKVKNVDGIDIPADSITREAGGIPVMVNSCMIGAFCRSLGIDWDYAEGVLRREFAVKTSLNIDIAKLGYGLSQKMKALDRLDRGAGRVLSGSEAISLGLCFGGLDGYIAYPMSPASGILHFLSSKRDEFGLKVFQPEGEIAAILIAEGMACCGCRTAVGTSGGGFCLMNEGLAYSGLAEIPVVIVNAQRQSPSTGAPTYTAQSDLHYAINAGHGEFPRIVVSPGDAEQAFTWSAKAVGLAWKYQTPVIILSDVTLNDSSYSFDPEDDLSVDYEYETKPAEGDSYLRYHFTEDGVSPHSVFPDNPGVIKINGKTHSESGISSEDPEVLERLADKRLRKCSSIKKGLDSEDCVSVSGNPDSKMVLVSWGSNAPLCREIAQRLDLKSVQPIVLNPFPERQFHDAVGGSERIVVVEDNSTGQLSDLLKYYGFDADERILNYSGRQMTVDYLEARIKEVL